MTYMETVISEIRTEAKPNGKLGWVQQRAWVDLRTGVYQRFKTLHLFDDQILPNGFTRHRLLQDGNTVGEGRFTLMFAFYSPDRELFQLPSHRIFPHKIVKNDPERFTCPEMTGDHPWHIPHDLNWIPLGFSLIRQEWGQPRRPFASREYPWPGQDPGLDRPAANGAS